MHYDFVLLDDIKMHYTLFKKGLQVIQKLYRNNNIKCSI